MGDNNLSSIVDGNTSSSSDVNQYKTALSGDIYPRAADGTTSNGASDLGGSSNKFKDGYFSETVICADVDASSTVSVGGLDIREGENATLLIDSGSSTIGFAGRYTTTDTTSVQISDGAIVTDTVSGSGDTSGAFQVRKTITFTLDAGAMVAFSLQGMSYGSSGQMIISPSNSTSAATQATLAYVYCASSLGDANDSYVRYYGSGTHTIVILYQGAAGGSASGTFSIAAV